MTTKQQEFLDTLKDPVQALIKKACDEINSRGYRHGLHVISETYMKKFNAYVVIARADNPDVLESTKDQFIRYFKQATPNARIHVSSRATVSADDSGNYFLHYFIDFVDGPDTISYLGKTMTDPGYFYCPYTPTFTNDD